MIQRLEKTSFLTALLIVINCTVQAQPGNAQPAKTIHVPMEPGYWQHDANGVDFVTYENVRAIHIKAPAPLIPKNVEFANGTIEYDVALGQGFPGITFHLSADGRNADQFYLRYFGSTSPDMRMTVQYAAMIDSMSIWDLTDEYQSGATLRIPGWNHVKLIVSGRQLLAYVNDMHRATLQVPALEGNAATGRIAFSGGEQTIANLVIKPGAVEGLPPAQGYLSAYNDTRYLRHWQVGPVWDYAFGKEITPPLPYMGGKKACPEYPDSATRWTPLATEPRAMLNLTRALGSTPFGRRRLVWVKTTIGADSAQERNLHLGFSDEVWLFVNGKMVYADKNYFASPIQKYPSGRCTIENAVVRLPLQKGSNEVLVAIANSFYGWGLIARLDTTDGLQLPR